MRVKILRVLKYSLISLFFLVLSLLITIQIPYVQKKIVNKVFNVINNRYFTLHFTDFSIKNFTTIEVCNVKISPVDINISPISISKISFKFDIFSIFFNNKIVVEDIYIDDVEITVESGFTSRINGFKHSDINYVNLFKFFTLLLKRVKVNNFVIDYKNDKSSVRSIVKLDIANLEINDKCVKVVVNRSELRNEYILVSNFSGCFNYYFVSDSLSCNFIISSNYLDFSGDLYLSGVSGLLNNKVSFADFDAKLNIGKLLLHLGSINKLLNKKLKMFSDDVLLSGKVFKDKKNIRFKDIIFDYKNDRSNIDLDITDVDELKKCKYNLFIKNGFPFANFIFGAISDEKTFTPILYEFLSDVNLHIFGDHDIIDGDIIVNSLKNIFKIKTKISAKLSNLTTWDINKIFDDININVSSKNFASSYINKLSADELLFEFYYNFKTLKNNFKFIFRNVFFYGFNVDVIEYKGKFFNGDITANLDISNKIVKISARNDLSLKDLSCLLQGRFFIDNISLANDNISHFSTNFRLNMLKFNDQYKLENLLSNIKMYINDVPHDIDDINTLFSYKNGLLDASLISDFASMSVVGADIKSLINDLNVIKRSFLNVNKDELFSLKDGVNYNTSIKVFIKNLDMFSFNFYDIIGFEQFNLEFYISKVNGSIRNKIILDVGNISFVNSCFNAINVTVNNTLSSDFKFNSLIGLKCKTADNDIKFNSSVVFFNDLIKTNVFLSNGKDNLISSSFCVNLKDNVYLSIDNVKNYVRFFNNNLTTKGAFTYNSKCFRFDNFSIFDNNKNIYLKADGKYDLDFYKNFSDLNILINNIHINTLNAPLLNGLNCNVSGKISAICNKINVDLLFNDLQYCAVNYNNINLHVDTILINNIWRSIFNLRLRQCDGFAEKVNIYGQVFYTNNLFFSLNVDINNFDLVKLKPFFNNILDIRSGELLAQYELKGRVDNVLLNGNGSIKNLGLYVIKTNCCYDNINCDLFSFNSDNIGFYSVKAHQNGIECGNFSSFVSFKTLFNPFFSLEGSFYNCNVFNKEFSDNYFYGSLNGTGNLLLKVDSKKLSINSKINFNGGNLCILTNENFIDDIDVSTSKTFILNKIKKRKHSIETDLKFDLNFDKNTNICLKFNDFSKLDLIGYGDVCMRYGNQLRLNGSYFIDTGSYNITVASLLNKKFLIKNGVLSFNNAMQHSNIDVVALSDLYTIYIGGVKRNVFLEVSLKGSFYSPDINYCVLFVDKKVFNNDLKKFFAILFFNNFDDSQLTSSANIFLNNFCSKFVNSLNKNLKLDINCNLLDIFFDKNMSGLRFDLKYRLNDKVELMKKFDFSDPTNSYKDLSLSINSGLQNNIFQNIILFKTKKSENLFQDSENIAAYNLSTKFEF